jgi:hypothetical protein
METKEYIPFRIINKHSKEYVHADNDGRGDLRLHNVINDNCQLFYLENVSNNFRIRNLNSGYFVHGDKEGTQFLRQFYVKNDVCQLFELQNDKFINKHSKEYMHADKDGRGDLRFHNVSNDICQRFYLEYHNYNDFNTSINKFVNNTQELDNHLIDLYKPNRICGINNKNWIDISNNNNRMKPIFAYLKYIEKKVIPEGTEREHEFKKIKGTVKTWSISVNITTSIGASFKFVEASTSISLGYDYSQQISESIEETWRDKVTGPATYYVYQPVIVFALDQPNGYNYNPFGTNLIHLAGNNPFTTTVDMKAVVPEEAEYIIAKNKHIWNITSIIL